MSNAIRDGIEAPISNSLSPEPCALVPGGHPCLSGNWVPLSPPCRTRRMDALASLVGVIA